MFVFYGDDSGSTPNQGAFMVSGYVARASTWFYDVEVPWSRVLSTDPRIGYSKSSQCEHLDGQFKGLTRVAADEKRQALIAIITKLAANDEIREYSSVIRWDDYQSGRDRRAQGRLPESLFLLRTGCRQLDC